MEHHDLENAEIYSMEHFVAYMREHKLFSFVLGVCVCALINCCAFPVFDLTGVGDWAVAAANLFIVLLGAALTGGILAVLFPQKKLAVLAFLAAAASAGAGLLGRHYTQGGATSDVGNFTLPNILLHGAVFLVGVMLTWGFVACRGRKNG